VLAVSMTEAAVEFGAQRCPLTAVDDRPHWSSLFGSAGCNVTPLPQPATLERSEQRPGPR
jgi:hypothetical protein